MALLTETDLHFDTGCQIQLHQCVYSFFGGLDNVEKTLMGTDFILITSVFVDVWRNQNRKTFFSGWQRDRTTHLGASTLRSINDFLRRLVDQTVIKRLKADSDLLSLTHFVLTME